MKAPEAKLCHTATGWRLIFTSGACSVLDGNATRIIGTVMIADDGVIHGATWLARIVMEGQRTLNGVQHERVEKRAEWAKGKFTCEHVKFNGGEGYQIYDHLTCRSAYVAVGPDGRYYGVPEFVSLAITANVDRSPEYRAFIAMLERFPEPTFN